VRKVALEMCREKGEKKKKEKKKPKNEKLQIRLLVREGAPHH
jgi:hypothetical protein